MKILLAAVVLFVFALAVGVGDDTGVIPGYHHAAGSANPGA